MTSSPPCWWTKTKDLSLASFVRPPEVVRFSIVIGVSRDWLKTSYGVILFDNRKHSTGKGNPILFKQGQSSLLLSEKTILSNKSLQYFIILQRKGQIYKNEHWSISVVSVSAGATKMFENQMHQIWKHWHSGHWRNVSKIVSTWQTSGHSLPLRPIKIKSNLFYVPKGFVMV